MRLLYLLLIILFSHNIIVAKYHFDFNTHCTQAYKKIMALNFDEGKTLLATEREEHPDNLIVPFLEDYIDVLTIVIDEDKTQFDMLKSNKEKRLTLMDAGDKNSPYFRLCKAEIYLHWAMARFKFEEFLIAGNEIRQANSLLKDNQTKFPEFQQNYKSLGMIHAVAGTLPDKYNWIISLLGFNGNIQQGMKEVKTYLDYSKAMDTPFYEESNLIYTFFILYLQHDAQKAYARIISNELPNKNNVLNSFIAAIIAIHSFHTDKAIQILQASPKQGYKRMYIMDYLLGASKLFRGDEDAISYLKSYTDNFKGRHYIKEAYQKIAWYYATQANEAMYKKYITYCIAKGYKLVDADKHALKEALSGVMPHPELLLARLRFDGGFFTEAQAVMDEINFEKLNTTTLQAEYYYRQGRIYQLLLQSHNSIAQFKKAIQYAEKTGNYFAPKSCLEIALIYEKQYNDKANAVIYFKKVLSYRDYPFKDSFDQQAKAGLNRNK